MKVFNVYCFYRLLFFLGQQGSLFELLFEYLEIISEHGEQREGKQVWWRMWVCWRGRSGSPGSGTRAVLTQSARFLFNFINPVYFAVQYFEHKKHKQTRDYIYRLYVKANFNVIHVWLQIREHFVLCFVPDHISAHFRPKRFNGSLRVWELKSVLHLTPRHLITTGYITQHLEQSIPTGHCSMLLL